MNSIKYEREDKSESSNFQIEFISHKTNLVPINCVTNTEKTICKKKKKPVFLQKVFSKETFTYAAG